MELTVRNSFKAVIILVVGYALGLLSFALYRGEMPFLSLGHTADKGAIARAECAPVSDEESILFLTCGGIY